MDYNLAHLVTRIARHQPFCLKDPRFGFTLPFWRPYLPDDVRFLVVFRHPADTIASILKYAGKGYPGRPLAVTERWAVDHWKQMYMSILDQREQDSSKNWMFVNFERVLSGESIGAIESFCEADLDAGHLVEKKVIGIQERGGTIEEECKPLLYQLQSMANRDVSRGASR